MFAQQLVNGLMLSGVYALVAVAFTLTIGVLNFLNFSIPALFMLGGMISCAMLAAGYSFIVSALVALCATAAASLVVERFTFRWMRGVDPHIPLVSSLGFLILYENVVLVLMGSDALGYPSPFGSAAYRIAGVALSIPQLLGCALSLSLVAACYAILRRTRVGRNLRSIAENSFIAELLGVKVGLSVATMYVATGVLAGVAGILFGVSYLQASWSMGSEVALKGICAMVLGGMGNVWGALLGAVLIAVVEVMTIAYGASEAVNVVVYGLLFALVALCPQGLLGDRASAVERM